MKDFLLEAGAMGFFILFLLSVILYSDYYLMLGLAIIGVGMLYVVLKGLLGLFK